MHSFAMRQLRQELSFTSNTYVTVSNVLRPHAASFPVPRFSSVASLPSFVPSVVADVESFLAFVRMFALCRPAENLPLGHWAAEAEVASLAVEEAAPLVPEVSHSIRSFRPLGPFQNQAVDLNSH